MDGFDLSLLIISPRFCLVQQKKILYFYKTWLVLFLILTDCHLMSVFLSYPVHFQSLCSSAMLLYHQRYALFSLFDCWLFIRVHIFHLLWEIEKEVGERQSINTWNVHWNAHDKNHKKTFRISLKHSNIHLTLFSTFDKYLIFFCIQVLRASQPQMPPIDSILHFFFRFSSRMRMCDAIVDFFIQHKKAKNFKHMKKIKEMVFLSLFIHDAQFFPTEMPKNVWRREKIFYCTKNSHFYNPYRAIKKRLAYNFFCRRILWFSYYFKMYKKNFLLHREVSLFCQLFVFLWAYCDRIKKYSSYFAPHFQVV